MSILYNNCEIPAKLFYNEVIGKSNLNALGKGKPEHLNKAFYDIIDELCALEDNKALISVYKKRFKLTQLVLTKEYIETALHRITFTKMTPELRREKIEKWLQPLKYPKIKFDFNKPILEEIERVSRTVKMLNNEINTHNDDIQDKGKKANIGFEEEVAGINRITGCRVLDTDTLRQFIAYKKQAKEIVKAQEKANGK